MERLTMDAGVWYWVLTIAKILGAFTILMVAVAYATLAERKISAWLQDRHGPNRVGPFGILQPIADGIKNIIKEETDPETASRFFFFLGPMLAIIPALVIFAVIPFAAPLPTPWGVMDMIVADVPIGVLYILAFGSLSVYGLFLSGWASNNKYAFLGSLRASAQFVSYEVAMGLSLIVVMMLAGNVTLTEFVWKQQQLDMWFALPLSLAFILFMISAFAETNRLPFDMPEAESELITGYHTEYSSMKFSMFFIAEYAHMITASALMATLFFGGWDIPGPWDDAFWYQGALISGFDATGEAIAAAPSVIKTVLTFGAFCLKTSLFLILYIWVRWSLPRFRYDQVMSLGWKVMLPVSLAYVMLVAMTILVLDELGVAYGFRFGAVLTGVSALATGAFVFFLDRGRTIRGASASAAVRRIEVVESPQLEPTTPNPALLADRVEP